MNKVVITGLGFVSSCGSSKELLWEIMQTSYTKPESISRFDTSAFSSHHAFCLNKDYNIKNYTNDPKIRRKRLYSQMVVAAGVQAMHDAGIEALNYIDPSRIGSILTTLNGPLDVTFTYLEELEKYGPKSSSPDLFQQTVFNASGGQLSILFGLKGVSSTLVGCSSIQYAYDLICSDKADCILVGGMEELHQHIYYAYDKQSKLATDCGSGEHSMPLSKDANGAVLGEGSGIVVLESLKHAEKRNAKIYAEILSKISLTDTVFNKDFCKLGDERSNGFFCAMDGLIKRSGLSVEDIDFISLASNSHPAVDQSELRAITNICYKSNAEWSGIASKAFLGETFGNSEMFALIAALICFEKNRVPGLKYLADEQGQKSILAKQKDDVKYGLVNSFFIGGGISSLILHNYIQ